MEVLHYKTLYLERLGADSVATEQRAWALMEVQQGWFSFDRLRILVML